MRQDSLREPVLFVTQHYSPEVIGSGPYCTDLAEGLVERGRPVTVLAGLPQYPNLTDFAQFNADAPLRQKVRGVRIERLHSWLPRKRSAMMRIASELAFMATGLWALLRGRIQRHDEVVSLCPSIFTVLLGIVATAPGGRHVALVHDIQSGLARSLGIVRFGLLVHLMRLCERLLLNRVDLVLVLSDEMATELRLLGVKTTIELLPIWVDTTEIMPRPSSQTGNPILAYSGNFGRKQGLEQIVDLAVRFKSERPDVRFILRGAGGERDAVATAVSGQKLDNVRLEELLPRERLSEALASGDIHLVPQNPEGANFAVPSKVYNIMAAGRCFVTTALPGSALWNLQAESQAFLCVPPHNPQALAEAVSALLDDAELRRTMGERGRQYVERQHDRRIVLDRLDELLTRLSREGNIGPRQGDLLILEPDADGHPEEWLRHLLQHASRRGNIGRIWLVLPPALAGRLMEGLPAAWHNRVRVLKLTPQELKYCTHRRLAVSGFARWWVMRRYLRITGAVVGYFLSLDHLSLPLGLGLGAGTAKLGGILFRPSVHYPALGQYQATPAERLRDWRKMLLYRGMLRNPAVSIVLTLDPFFPDYALDHYVGGHKVRPVPDPAYPPPVANDDDLPVQLPDGRIVFLLFGVLTERKGVLHLVDALRLLGPNVAAQIAIVLAGKVATEIRRDLSLRLARLKHDRPGLWLHLEDRWLGAGEIAALVRRSDVILAPYQRFVGSSGVLLWAAQAGKPLLTQDYGLVGRLVHDHKLGLAVDATRPERLAYAMTEMVARKPSDFFNPVAAQAFVSERTPEAFSDQVFSTLQTS
jgi:colanic acid biosynthesis glycosyl transferase WcaI